LIGYDGLYHHFGGHGRVRLGCPEGRRSGEVPVDEVDEQLVRALQRDGRASYEALAGLVGLARSTTKARVQRLLSDGLHLVGMVHPAVLGLSHHSHVVIEVEGPAEPVAARVATLHEASFVTTTAGRFAVTAELRTGGTDEFVAGLAAVTAIAGVRDVGVVTYRRIWKDPYFPPGPLEQPALLRDVDLDAADHALLQRLRADGRASFAELAGVSGLSPAATRTRVLRLLDSGVVHIGALVRLTPLRDVHTVGFALTFRGAPDPAAQRIVEMPEIDCLAVGFGWCNGIGTIRTHSYDSVFNTLERLRALPGVGTVEAWTHLRAFKEENDLARPITGVRASQ
jgi:DNA-binding Lrp family transcriptional regulator